MGSARLETMGAIKKYKPKVLTHKLYVTGKAKIHVLFSRSTISMSKVLLPSTITHMLLIPNLLNGYY